MSYIKGAGTDKIYMADYEIINVLGAETLIFKSNVPTYIYTLFDDIPSVGDRYTFADGSYLKVTNRTILGSYSKYDVYWFTSTDTQLAGNPSVNIYSDPASIYYHYVFIGFDYVNNGIAFINIDKYIAAGNFSTQPVPLNVPVYYNFRPSTTIDYPYYRFVWANGPTTVADQQLAYNALSSEIVKSIYFPGETSETGGGTGSFDTTSDEINFPSVPTLSAVNAGFITLYAPTLAQLNSLASYLWSSSFDLDTFKKLFADPMDVIIGLSIVPVAVPVSGSSSVKIGFIDSGVSMNLASSQYVTVNCGTLTPAEYWGSALDYSPYTKFSIYLPYIGTRELNTDDIMGKTLQVVYNIDILSGACTAMIKCGGSVLYEFSGACATSIPVTGQNWTQLITSCIQLAGAGIAVAASGGSAAGLLPSTANAVMAMKPNIQRTGAVSGSAGMLGVQQPYLIWELPRQSIARDYNKFVGYPSNITALLSTLTGYTQIESIHLDNIHATQSELAEIETLLKEGVII